MTDQTEEHKAEVVDDNEVDYENGQPEETVLKHNDEPIPPTEWTKEDWKPIIWGIAGFFIIWVILAVVWFGVLPLMGLR